MAKYCAKCGKALPEGVEICPDCHATAQEDGAAPFTRMTAETEVWKTPEEKTRRPKRERPKRTRTQKQIMGIAAAAAAVLALAVFLIIYVQPANRVARYIRGGNYERAIELYWGSETLSSGARDGQIGRAALQAGEKVLDRYAAHELSADEAASALSKLGGLGANAEALLSDVFAKFRAYNESQNHMAKAEKLTLNGDYLAARDEYLLVAEGDSDYAEAREKAEESLGRYTERALSEANVLIQTGDYGAAIDILTEAERALLGYEVYSEKLDYKRGATYALFEEDLLSDAAELAALGDYASAAEKLRQGMERYDYETDALTAAMEGYLGQAKEKILAEAAERAGRLYAQGSVKEAFAVLDELKALPGSKTADVDAAIAALEDRFAADKIAEAEEAFGTNRETLPDAMALLEAALELRDVAAIRDYLDDISRYLPVSLAELDYTSKEGTLLRYASTGTTDFESLDGTTYADGWIWGENGAEVTFALDGGFDLLEGVLAVRREGSHSAAGHFEVICDGEPVYVSKTLRHSDAASIPVSVELNGCDMLTLRFVTDYTVSTAEGGYCYHGLCSPTVTKSLPEA